MSRSPRQPVQLAGTIFRGSAAIAAGLLSKDDLRTTAWRRLFRGVYADAKIMLTYRLRCKAVLWFVGPPGSVLAGATAVHFHGGAESPPESRVRVRLMLAGVPKPQTQYVIRRVGRFIARVDMAWPAQKVAVEYDDAWHDSSGQFDKDRARLNKLMAEGWLILHLTAQRTREDFPGFTAELKSALRSRS